VLAQAVLAAYWSLLAAGPLDHHDVACHLKSATHCTTCVQASVPDTAARPGTHVVPLLAADTLRPARSGAPTAACVSKPGDRSPPTV
jgi:hypothetical protein